jgi:AAHS family 4-hydroxybenzoate transporter-like MFS transporter
VFGALIGAFVIQRLGSRFTMLSLTAMAIVGAFVIAKMGISPESRWILFLICIGLSGAINAVQVAMYALAAHVYPTEIRGVGIGTTVAVGRVGNVLASYVGIWALNIGGAPAYFATFGVGMIAVFIALAIVQRHIER